MSRAAPGQHDPGGLRRLGGGGFCTLRPTPGRRGGNATAEIWALFVQPSHWRRGVGRLLCERSCADARRRGLAGVELWELESNAGARRFFHALGFRPDGRKRVFLEHAGVSLHELRYRRTTPPARSRAGRS